VFDGYQQAAVGVRRIRELLHTPTSTPQAAHPRPAPRGRARIELRDVHFGYPGGGKEALAGVSLTVAPGETVALVGQTGAGKSTLVKLVARYYDVTGGRVLVDGTDIRDLDLASYRQRLGVVPQEAFLFAGTVREAIAYGRPEASDAQIRAAAGAVGALDMISRLSGGFDHEVAERGRNLSAGQRQLIALARAYLVDPDILLLDEATAALDLVSEAAVARAAERLEDSRTTLVVAHRRRPRRPDRGARPGPYRRVRYARRAARRGRYLRLALGRVHRRRHARRLTGSTWLGPGVPAVCRVCRRGTEL